MTSLPQVCMFRLARCCKETSHNCSFLPSCYNTAIPSHSCHGRLSNSLTEVKLYNMQGQGWLQCPLWPQLFKCGGTGPLYNSRNVWNLLSSLRIIELCPMRQMSCVRDEKYSGWTEWHREIREILYQKTQIQVFVYFRLTISQSRKLVPKANLKSEWP